MKRHPDFLWLEDGWWDLSYFWADIEARGRKLHEMYKDRKTHTNWVRDGGGVKGSIAGEAAEWAFGLHVNLVPKPIADKGPDSPENGIDFTLRCGLTVDVKGSQYFDEPYLRWPKSRDDALRAGADTVVVVGVNMPKRRARVQGWATSGELLDADVLGAPICAKEPAHVIFPADLHLGTPTLKYYEHVSRRPRPESVAPSPL